MEVRSPMADMKALTGCSPVVLYEGARNSQILGASVLITMCIENCSSYSQPNKDGAAQTYWSLAAHWTGRVAQNHILVFHYPVPLLLVSVFFISGTVLLTACLNATLSWLCGLWSLTVRLKTTTCMRSEIHPQVIRRTWCPAAPLTGDGGEERSAYILLG